MNTYYIIDNEFKLVKPVELYTSLIWNESYKEAGDFELYIDATAENVEFYTMAIKSHYYMIKVPSEPATRFDINYLSCMMISDLKIDYDFENGNKIILTGRSAKYLLSQRVIFAPQSFAGNIKTVLEQLVTDNCITPTDINRVIPRLSTVDIGDVITDVTDYQSGGENIYDICVNACADLEIGWDIMYDMKNKRLVFFIYKGHDLSNKVIFSPSFDNLLSTEYSIETSKAKNVAITYYKSQTINELRNGINQEDKYIETTSFRQSSSYSGYDRKELFIDNSSSTINGESNDDILTNQYQMTTEAKTQLKDREYKPTFSGEVVTSVGFTFVTDYNLGDIVRIQNDYGHSYTARVGSVKITHDSNTDTTVPSFEIIDNDDEDKYTESDYRVTEDGQYRVASNNEIRIKILPHKDVIRFCEDREERVAENGEVIFAIVGGRYKEV